MHYENLLPIIITRMRGPKAQEDMTGANSQVHEGSMYRKFEGEADRSHHGPAPNRLYSTAHNMRTWISEGLVRGPFPVPISYLVEIGFIIVSLSNPGILLRWISLCVESISLCL